MHWFQALDIELFRFANQALVNPVLDVLMPFVSGNAFFYPALVLLGGLLIWKGKGRGVLCVLMLAVVLGLGDGLVINNLKHAVGRERPFMALADVRLLVGKGGSGSMPSSHAANWFAATMVALVYYRRSLWFMLPAALVVGFSRLYVGVHYPSDVLAGAILGAGYAAAFLWLLDWAWQAVGTRWFPLWWAKLPSLLSLRSPEECDEEPLPLEAMPATRGIAPAGFQAPHATLDGHWLRLGYVCVFVLLVVKWVYIASGTIQLSGDEAYQWLWSKHLALSYYSKPPLIAYTQFLGTSLWGDTAFGVRFFSPLISAALGILVLRFFAREINARAGFFLLLITNATPLLAAGSVLMTIDPLSILFWTAAMVAGWRASQEKSTVSDWLWVGVWMGLGFLSKYTELFQLLCWVVFFILWRPARRHLRRPGPYLALLLNAALALPVLIWNAQHGWITASHVAGNAGLDQAWHPTVQHALEFIAGEAGLLNPVFFVGMVWAAVAFWKRGRHNPRLMYFFSMGAPLFLCYFLYSFRSRLQMNWIAPSVLPLFCLMVAYWDARLRLGVTQVKTWLTVGLVLGCALVVFGYNTNLVRKLTSHYLPVKYDPLHRVREWDTTAKAVGQAREALLKEGKPVFIIADHYGLTSQISFYLPEARAGIPDQPLVYFRSSEKPENQFYFWPGYGGRKGENAVFVHELDRDNPQPQPPPPQLLEQFESVSEMGVSNIMYHGEFLLRPLQLYACRGMK